MQRVKVHQQSAAAKLLEERQITHDNLNRRGVLTRDVPANQLSLAVIQLYLDVEAKLE